MSLGIRGANPIWSLVNLSGKQFDDTYYMWVLQNQIPYIPANVYHDPDLNIVWGQPIQFLANGTLPNDIFFESEVVYRLEFRQHIGLGSPSQSDPLIYLVENYVAGQGGSTPVDTLAFASSNQVTNPQFALINFASPFTFSGTDPATMQIAPGWFLDMAGTGTVTVTQVPLNSTNANPTNAPYALQLTLSGWTANSVRLSQRFEQNGMLWANKIVSTAITAKLNGAPQAIGAILIDSNNSTLGTVLPANTTVDESFNEFTGYAQLGSTSNTDTPPAAYIDYRLSLPSNIDIYLTSIQLVVQDLPLEPSFEQDSINRQIDHTYNTAYPIVPVGTVIDFAGFSIPSHYYLCDGTAISRTSNNLLFQALTHLETVTLSNGSPTFTVISSADYHIGMPLEGTGIPAATTISNIVGTTITMSANATVSAPSSVRFFGTGNGNGSTTFNVPDLRDFVTASMGGSLFGAANNGVGGSGGSATQTLTSPNQLPAHHHASSTGGGFVVAGGITTLAAGAGASESVVANTADTGSSAPFDIVQQTYLMKKCIRFE